MSECNRTASFLHPQPHQQEQPSPPLLPLLLPARTPIPLAPWGSKGCTQSVQCTQSVHSSNFPSLRVTIFGKRADGELAVLGTRARRTVLAGAAQGIARGVRSIVRTQQAAWRRQPAGCFAPTTSNLFLAPSRDPRLRPGPEEGSGIAVGHHFCLGNKASKVLAQLAGRRGGSQGARGQYP